MKHLTWIFLAMWLREKWADRLRDQNIHGIL